jgi:hypothetical protein
MKPEHLLAIALRVFAIYLSVSTITGLITSGWFYMPLVETCFLLRWYYLLQF